MAHSTVSLDGLVIGIPGSGPSNVLLNTTETNLTIEPGTGNDAGHPGQRHRKRRHLPRL